MKYNKFDGNYSGWVPYFCINCKHLGDYNEGVPTCGAYTDGIPVEIWRNEGSKNLCKGGNGLQYEEIELTKEEQANLPKLMENI